MTEPASILLASMCNFCLSMSPGPGFGWPWDIDPTFKPEPLVVMQPAPSVPAKHIAPLRSSAPKRRTIVIPGYAPPFPVPSYWRKP